MPHETTTHKNQADKDNASKVKAEQISGARESRSLVREQQAICDLLGCPGFLQRYSVSM
jgi:hypothetical protein